MTINKIDTSSSTTHSNLSSPHLLLSTDCSPFLNWNEGEFEIESEVSVVFWSLVATVKLQPALDASLEVKAVTLLEYVHPQFQGQADDFLTSHGQTTAESLTNFVQSIMVLLSIPSQSIAIAVVKILGNLIEKWSPKVRLALVQADLIPQIIATLNPLSLSFAEAESIHINLMKTINWTIWLSTPNELQQLRIKDDNEQRTVLETILKQVLAPSEKYICHLCVNRFSIIDSKQSEIFMFLLADILQISPYYQPTMDFVVNMPVILTIPSSLTFFEYDDSTWSFLFEMNCARWDWNVIRSFKRHMWKTVHRMLRMEGMEDVMEEKLRTNQDIFRGSLIVTYSIVLNNIQGTVHPSVTRLFSKSKVEMASIEMLAVK
ncbi:hypothetical protein BLNAU_11968 [Blattamonas nauphoetae]|uniref:Uncharacterized protein n=1 Tax=Blattamonas nauphoetae TaxID=2049346 RepID=A0ABQ9XN76_9EUKA|nr:hypothetical protein BLNAU_11968 [Blattamonas nauphoetae]